MDENVNFTWQIIIKLNKNQREREREMVIERYRDVVSLLMLMCKFVNLF